VVSTLVQPLDHAARRRTGATTNVDSRGPEVPPFNDFHMDDRWYEKPVT